MRVHPVRWKATRRFSSSRAAFARRLTGHERRPPEETGELVVGPTRSGSIFVRALLMSCTLLSRRSCSVVESDCSKASTCGSWDTNALNLQRRRRPRMLFCGTKAHGRLTTGCSGRRTSTEAVLASAWPAAGQDVRRHAITRSLPMTPTITAFEQSPDRGKGLARDMRVRWALEEVNQPYDVRLVSFSEMKEPAHRALHPFGQIPTYEEGDLALFESGAIVFHIAERHAGLLPDDANARARAITWMFAALNTVEPPILELGTARLLESDKPWSKQRMPLVEDRVRGRLNQLSVRLGDADWLDGEFSA